MCDSFVYWIDWCSAVPKPLVDDRLSAAIELFVLLTSQPICTWMNVRLVFRQLPFFALCGRYYISEALYLSVLFHFLQFLLPLFVIASIHLHYEGLRYFDTVLPKGVLSGRYRFSVFSPSGHSKMFSSNLIPVFFFAQAKRSQAVCPDPSVPVNALAWRLSCDAVTSTFTHCPKASRETWLNCEFLGNNYSKNVSYQFLGPGVIAYLFSFDEGRLGTGTKQVKTGETNLIF